MRDGLSLVLSPVSAVPDTRHIGLKNRFASLEVESDDDSPGTVLTDGPEIGSLRCGGFLHGIDTSKISLSCQAVLAGMVVLASLAC